MDSSEDLNICVDLASTARAMSCGADGLVFLLPSMAESATDDTCTAQLDRILKVIDERVPAITISGQFDQADPEDDRDGADGDEVGENAVSRLQVPMDDLRGALSRYATLLRQKGILHPVIWILDPLWLPFVERAYARLVIFHDLQTELEPDDDTVKVADDTSDTTVVDYTDEQIQSALDADEASPPAFSLPYDGAQITQRVAASAQTEWLSNLLDRHVHGTVLTKAGRMRDLSRVWPFPPNPKHLDDLLSEGFAGVDAWFSQLATKHMRESGKLDILMLCAPASLKINTVREYVESFSTYSCHNFRFSAAPHKRAPNCVALEEPKTDYNSFDVVMIHYSARICVEGFIDSDVEEALTHFAGFKVLFIQDEYQFTEVARRWIKRIGIHLVYTVVPEQHIHKVYPKERFVGTEFVSVLTGYAPVALENAVDAPPLRERPNYIVYRGNDLPYFYGLLGREKLEIGRKMRAIAEERGLPVDIEWLRERKIHGTDWYRFLQSGRATLATESGTNIFDIDGDLSKRVNEIVKENPYVTFEEVHADFLDEHEEALGFKMNQFSPKLFEFIAARTALILYRGEYSGILQPDVHYILLEKDFSNIDEVLAKLEDLAGLEAMIERAFTDVIASGEYRYSTFVRQIDEKLAQYLRGATMWRMAKSDFGMLDQAVSLREQLALLSDEQSVGSDNAAMDNLIAHAGFKAIYEALQARQEKVIETNQALRARIAQVHDAYLMRGERMAALAEELKSERDKAFDTLQTAKDLKSLNFTDQQAEGLAEVVRKLDAAHREELVTKEFFRTKLRADLRQLVNWLIIGMVGFVIVLGGVLFATRIFA